MSLQRLEAGLLGGRSPLGRGVGCNVGQQWWVWDASPVVSWMCTLVGVVAACLARVSASSLPVMPEWDLTL